VGKRESYVRATHVYPAPNALIKNARVQPPVEPRTRMPGLAVLLELDIFAGLIFCWFGFC
jgi:hypothetical protein